MKNPPPEFVSSQGRAAYHFGGGQRGEFGMTVRGTRIMMRRQSRPELYTREGFLSDNFYFSLHVGMDICKTFFVNNYGRLTATGFGIPCQFLPLAKTFLLVMTSRCSGPNTETDFASALTTGLFKMTVF